MSRTVHESCSILGKNGQPNHSHSHSHSQIKNIKPLPSQEEGNARAAAAAPDNLSLAWAWLGVVQKLCAGEGLPSRDDALRGLSPMTCNAVTLRTATGDVTRDVMFANLFQEWIAAGTAAANASPQFVRNPSAERPGASQVKKTVKKPSDTRANASSTREARVTDASNTTANDPVTLTPLPLRYREGGDNASA